MRFLDITMHTAHTLFSTESHLTDLLPTVDLLIEVQSVIRAVDDTIPNSVRTLTAEKINSFEVAAARPNPETLGYLDQPKGDRLYYRQGAKIDYQSDIKNTPLIPTTGDVNRNIYSFLGRMAAITKNLKVWTTAQEPQ